MAARAPKVTVNGEPAKFIGFNAACKALGIATSNLHRYHDRLTRVPVEGSAAVYVKSEVRVLSRELAKRRRERERDTAAAKRPTKRAAAKKRVVKR